MTDRMQSQRFELKYLISEETALRVRDFVQSYLSLDEYSACQPHLAYPVHSLYLDSDTLKTYWDTINGNRNRFKLRLRFYDAAPDLPVYFEVKRRVNNCILKQRASVRQSLAPEMLRGFLPSMEQLLNASPKALVAMQTFLGLMAQIQAKPKVHIAYLREAYANDPGTVRVTMDRAVRAEPNLQGVLRAQMEHPHYAFTPLVILELKFTDRFPHWFGELVRVFHVMQRGAAKYCASVQAIGDGPLKTIFPVIPEEEVSIVG